MIGYWSTSEAPVGKNLTRRRGRNHKNMWHIQGSLITRSNAIVRCNKIKLINGHNIPIMGKMGGMALIYGHHNGGKPLAFM